MNLMKEQVRHNQFGLGTIVGQTTSTVEVRFGEAYGTKKFVYPSVFESFLVLCRPVPRESMVNELTQIRERIEGERRLQAEAEKLREEELRILLEQHAAAKKPAKPKSARAKKSAGKVS